METAMIERAEASGAPLDKSKTRAWLGALFLIVVLESHAFALDCCESVTKSRVVIRDSINAYSDSHDCQNLSLKGNEITALIEGDKLKCCRNQSPNDAHKELKALEQLNRLWKQHSNSCKPHVPFGK